MDRDTRVAFSDILQQAKGLYSRNYLYRYQGMRFKYFWIIAMPCLPIFLYNILNAIGVFGENGSETPRAITISVGVTFYTLFSESLVGFSNALESNKNYIVKTGIRFRACYLSSLFAVYTSFLIRFVVVLFVLSAYGDYLTYKLFYAFAYSWIPVLFGSSVGLFLSIFLVFYKDVENIVQTMSFYLLFASGVFIVVDGNSILERIVAALPSYVAVVNAKALMLKDYTLDLHWTTIWVAAAVLLTVISCYGIRNCRHLIMNYMR